MPFGDLCLLVESLVVLIFVKAGLSLMRFQTLRRRLKRLSSAEESDARDARSIKKVVWSVNKVSTYVPFLRNCLNRALATQLLLGRRGQAVDMLIGVASDQDGKFRAHAWIEVDGRIVLGGTDDIRQLTPLPPLNLRDIPS
jgi:hypothetical protein